jgi:predicted nuclease of predicted toxin-antitoxin system
LSCSLVADENIDARIIVQLLENGHDVYAVARECPGIGDEEVLMLAAQRKAVLITEDSNFGEWIFAHGHQGVSVVYLRYNHAELAEIIRAVQMVLRNYADRLKNGFVVVTSRKIRFRPLPYVSP